MTFTNPSIAPLPTADWRSQVQHDTGPIIRRGLIVVGTFVVLLGAWTAIVPLAGAIIGHGKVISSGQNSLLQHTVGGRIQAVRVHDGQHVKKGDIVIALDPTLESSTLNRFKERHKLLVAQQARLKTMIARVGKGIVPAGEDLVSGLELRGSDGGDDLSAVQNLELESGLRRHQEEIRSLSEQIESQKATVSGLDARLKGLAEQSKSIRDQLRRQSQLAEQGYYPVNRVAETERQAQEIEATFLTTKDSKKSAMSDLAGLEAKRAAASAAFKETLSQQLSDVATQAGEIENQILGADSQLTQAEIRSPVDGTLVKLTNQTIGGVIRGGEVIGEIVPDGAELQVEARLDPKDVVHVRTGQSAEVVFSAFNRHLTDPVQGKVTYLSPDALLDERQGISYFLARVTFDPKDKGLAHQDVTPGLSAEVYIDTDKRSFLSYLMKPVSDSFRRAFREP